MDPVIWQTETKLAYRNGSSQDTPYLNGRNPTNPNDNSTEAQVHTKKRIKRYVQIKTIQKVIVLKQRNVVD